MTNPPLDAAEIFAQFQTRRAVLRRGGAVALAAGLPVALAGCLEVADNAFVDTPTGRAILVEPGRNCWQGRCVTWNAGEDSLSVQGREPVPVPEGVDLNDGQISEAEFERLLQAARAGRVRVRESSGGEAGGGEAGGGASSI